MGLVFIMFSELWVTFFRHVQNYGSKFLTKMAPPHPNLGSVTPPPRVIKETYYSLTIIRGAPTPPAPPGSDGPVYHKRKRRILNFFVSHVASGTMIVLEFIFSK